MSKLAKLITATATGNRKAFDELKVDYSTIKITEIPAADYFAKEYKIEAIFSQSLYIDDSSTDKVADVLKTLRSVIIEELFGEFRKPLLDLQVSLYGRDYHKARLLLTNLQQQMFDVD